MTKRALITGVTGQDGSILAELLLERGWQVHGLHRHTSGGNLGRVARLAGRPGFHLHRGDVLDPGSVRRVVHEVQPHRLFHEADQDNVSWSRRLRGLAARLTYAATSDLLDAVRAAAPECRVFLPSSATVFGAAPLPQSEAAPLDPRSPYAVAKAAVLHLARLHRADGLHVSCGVLFTHTSTRQTEDYLLHKIAAGAVRVARGEQDALALGNPETRVDVGCAREFMEAAMAMVEADEPGDYVVGTGAAIPVGLLAELAFAEAGVAAGRRRLARDPDFWTDAPLPTLQADAGKALRGLGWAATRTAGDMVRELVRHYGGKA